LQPVRGDRGPAPDSRALLSSLHFFFSSRRRHTRWPRDWSSDVCSSDLVDVPPPPRLAGMPAPVDSANIYAGAGANDLDSTTRREIGRASCRERVEIAAVGGAIKKKFVS